MKQIKERLSCNRGDNSSISNLLWISLSVIVAVGVGALILVAMKGKAESVTDEVNMQHQDLFKQD